MRGIFITALRDLRGGLLGWGISLVLTTMLVMAIYPSYSMGLSGLQAFLDNAPPALKLLMGRYADLGSLEGYLAMEGYNMFLPSLFLIYGAITGAALVGGEEERGTLTLLLTYPVRRWRLVVDKFAALVVATLILAGATALGFVAGGLGAGISASYGRIVAATLNLVPLTLLFAALAFALTCAGWGRGAAAGLSGILAAGAYLVDALAPMVEFLDGPSRYLPFYLYGGGMPLREGVHLGHVAALLAMTALLAAAGIWAFERRDVGT